MDGRIITSQIPLHTQIQADAPLPPPVNPESLELWKADAHKATAEKAASCIGKEMEAAAAQSST